MATVTATKRSKAAKKVNVKNTLNDLNSALINGSEELIDAAVITGEKYQKLFAKSVKKSTPLVEKQVDIVFETIESLKDQFDFGTVRFKKLIGWNDKTIAKFRKNATKRVETLKKNAEDIIDDVQTELNERIPVIPAPTKAIKEVEVVAKKAVVRTKKVAARKAKAVTKTAKAVVSNTDLKVIDGIGPKMEKVLKAGGIKTIKALAKASATTVENTIEKSGTSLRGASVKSWISQAKKINK